MRHEHGIDGDHEQRWTRRERAPREMAVSMRGLDAASGEPRDRSATESPESDLGWTHPAES